MTTLAERLAALAAQLDIAEEIARAGDLKPEDLPALAEHLRVLGEHGGAIARVVDRIIEKAGPEYNDVQVYLLHAGSLFEAAQTFAGDAYGLLEKMSAAPS